MNFKKTIFEDVVDGSLPEPIRRCRHSNRRFRRSHVKSKPEMNQFISITIHELTFAKFSGFLENVLNLCQCSTCCN